ncbi:glycosyltransferase family 2 protein [Porticoccus sp. W117]|uniref:glycosyltransferase n=1 Tax=Porticoccus sp. W117 TaxID=3054777 RepID=UPI002595B6B0|nr:glycosyltransferase family 2 protein [Porticoccus sp. W117]MDM3870607.1 glycosyltransferase family 2 protein [Porticoccus sp. W117]
MKVAVVTVNYKTADMTLEAVSAAIGALGHIDDEWSITIVDNDSGDGSYEKMKNAVDQRRSDGLAGWESVFVLQSGNNGGFGAGNNFAIKKYLDSKNPPEYFYLLNSDAFPDSDAIQRLLDYMDENHKLGMAGSYIYGVDGKPHITAFRFPSIWGELEGGACLGIITKLLKNYTVPIGIPDQPAQVDWVAGASLMMRREMLEKVGLFDETFFLYFEETDLCRQAALKGWKTHYVPASKVAHIGSASTKIKESSDDAQEGRANTVRLPSYWFESRTHYFKKNHGKLYTIVATVFRVLGCGIWFCKRLISKDRNHVPPHFVRDLIAHTKV